MMLSQVEPHHVNFRPSHSGRQRPLKRGVLNVSQRYCLDVPSFALRIRSLCTSNMLSVEPFCKLFGIGARSMRLAMFALNPYVSLSIHD